MDCASLNLKYIKDHKIKMYIKYQINNIKWFYYKG